MAETNKESITKISMVKEIDKNLRGSTTDSQIDAQLLREELFEVENAYTTKTNNLESKLNNLSGLV